MFLIDDWINGMFNKWQTEQNMHNQFVYDLYKMDYQQGLQKSAQEFMWNKQYGAQVSGMKNAGLNPAGNASGIAGQTAPTVPIASGSAPQGNPMKMDGSGISDLLDILIKDKQAKIQEGVGRSEENVNDATAEAIRAQIPGNKAESDMRQKRNERYAELLGNEVTHGEKENVLLEEQSKTEQKKREAIDQEIAESTQRIEKMRAEVNKLGQEAAYLKMKTIMERKVLAAQEKELYALAKKHGADAAAAADQAWAALQNAITNSVVGKSEVERNEAEKEIFLIQKKLQDRYGDAEKIANIVGGAIGTAASAFLGVGIGAKALGLAGKGVTRVAGFFGH